MTHAPPTGTDDDDDDEGKGGGGLLDAGDPPIPTPSPPPPPLRPSLLTRLRSLPARLLRLARTQLLMTGPGIISATAYSDPGNYVTCLAAGATAGYRLLFIVLLVSLFAILIQVLSCRLGLVTGLDLAQATRAWVLGQPFERPDDGEQDEREEGPGGEREREREGGDEEAAAAGGNSSQREKGGRPLGHIKRLDECTTPRARAEWYARRVVLYGLYAVSEGAIIATELAELLGSAIALNLLFPAIPLYAGVLLTSLDVFLILFFYRPSSNANTTIGAGTGTRPFELFIALLVLVTLICFVIIIVRARPAWSDVFDGYLPSSAVVRGDALYLSVGILGATAMPHACYLCSHFSTLNRFAGTGAAKGDEGEEEELEDEPSRSSPNARALFLARTRHLLRRRDWRWTADVFRVRRLSSSEPGGDPSSTSRMSLQLVRAHLPFATVDIVVALLLFALTINSAILIVAGAALYYGARSAGEPPGSAPGDLYDAYGLLQRYVGAGSAVIFAVALLASAQAASITVTLSGQIISEGFLRWRVSPLLRRCITRLISLVPSLVVALAVGRDGLDGMLVASQVALSMALPFVLFPLFFMTGLRGVMRVRDTTTAAAGAREKGEGARPRSDASQVDASADADAGSSQQQQQQPPAQVEDAAAAAPPTDGPQRQEMAEQEQQQERAGWLSRARCLLPGHKPDAEAEAEDTARYAYFANTWPASLLAWAIFGVICIADVYVLATSL